MSAVDSFNLGDFLRIRDEEENRRRVDSFAGLTLSDILLSEKRVATAQTQINRTLLDVIRVPEPSSGVNAHQNQNQNQNQLDREKKTWKAIKDRLRLKRNGAVLTSSDIHSHRHDNSVNRTGFNRRLVTSTSGETDSSGPVVAHRDAADGRFSFSRRGSTMRLSDHIQLDPTEPARLGSSRRLSAAEEAVREETFPPSPAEGESDGEQPVRMSLMELLEETTDRQMGSTYDVGHDEEEEEKEAELAAPAPAPAEQKCCVCMVRHKGAAFIPCGHTFCRLCSRELLVQRGHCPLCNAQISEILDIF